MYRYDSYYHYRSFYVWPILFYQLTSHTREQKIENSYYNFLIIGCGFGLYWNRILNWLNCLTDWLMILIIQCDLLLFRVCGTGRKLHPFLYILLGCGIGTFTLSLCWYVYLPLSLFMSLSFLHWRCSPDFLLYFLCLVC